MLIEKCEGLFKLFLNLCWVHSFTKDTVDKNEQLEDSSSKQNLCEDGLNADITRTGVAPSRRYDDQINDSLSLLGFRGYNLQCSSINCSEKLSCFKILSLLSPQANSCPGSYTEIKNLICKYLSGSTEDYVISSLNSFVEGMSSDQQSLNFLSLVGFPYFSAINIPHCSRQPNISPLVGIINTPGYDYLLHPKAPFTLEDILHYSPNSLKSDWHIRFLIYQIFSALIYMHDLGIVHGNLCPSSILLSDSLWAWLSLADMQILKGKILKRSQVLFASGIHHHGDCSCEKNHTNLKLSTEIDWHSDFMKWWRGELSNYEYLLVLNKLAGRRWGDRTFHTVMPWVIDFSVKPDEKSDIGWRDLKKSKWRLAKGDEQLDFTYSTSEIPHHVSDECLSELAVCSYKARRLPLKILRSAVRSVYEPNEYPSNMQRLYQWTPDECIPDFYTDPQIFSSVHSEMSDLSIPSCASSPEAFILQHRSALESDHVSRHIHHWIDITFGYKLSGEASIAAKNVMLPASDPSLPRAMGRRQLFTRPHPVRQAVKSCSDYASSKEYLVNSNEKSDNGCALLYSYKDYQLPDSEYLGNLEKAISFCEASRSLNPVYSYNIKYVGDSPDLKNIVPSKMDKLNRCNCGKTIVDNTYLNTYALEATEKSSSMPLPFSLGHLLDFFESDDNSSMSFRDLLRWSHLSSFSRNSSEEFAGDIFSVGCLIAELYLLRSLFNPISLRAYKEDGVLPGHMQELPPCIAVLVEAAIQRDWKRVLVSCVVKGRYDGGEGILLELESRCLSRKISVSVLAEHSLDKQQVCRYVTNVMAGRIDNVQSWIVKQHRRMRDYVHACV
ncbi:hypothetical protein KSP40_PGU013831 [Platanthera guangdongensis]|uniref:BEACH domain-containing protein n=1 Tax=Platanthera guangdongensis TaxID=2320717 RepID=A0ABR2LNT8_9ASPA